MAQASVAARVGIAPESETCPKRLERSQRIIFFNGSSSYTFIRLVHNRYQERFAKKNEAEDLRRAFEKLDTQG